MIETATKLYGEFWGSLSNNLTVSNNLNLKKLFYIGNKLNQVLAEINLLWETDLKTRKIDLDNQSIVLLYAYFLREILKNKKKAEEISKKINDEQIFESKKTDSDKLDLDNLDTILENQDLVIYSRTNEKGECKVIQCSNSIVSIFGYSKQEIIGKKIETLMPSIYQAEHFQNLSKKIRILRSSYGVDKDIFKNTEKKQFFVLPKTKSGYLLPINSRFKIYNEDDFSNTFIIRSKFEPKDTKSIYAFYVLTKEDFTIDSISSSCLYLNLSMDILKKYVMNIHHLVRAEDVSEISFSERFQEFEEEPKRIIWIYPEILYPRTENVDLNNKSDFEIEEMIHNSRKKEMNLIITKARFRDDHILGYCFRFTNIEPRKQNQENVDIRLTFRNDKILLYDMKRLNYTRSYIVTQKTKKEDPHLFTTHIDQSFRRLKTHQEEELESVSNAQKRDKKRRRRNSSESESSEEERKLQDNILTVEKLNELQSKSREDIKNFIENLYNFGNGVSYYKRDTEFKNAYEDHFNKFALIKQIMDLYSKRQESRTSHMSEKKMDKKKVENTSIKKDAYISEFSSDAGAYLNEIFNQKSITNIRYFSFFLFILLCLIISVEFIISINIVNDCNDRIFYSEKAYKILNSILYTKFFLTEAVLAQDAYYTNIDDIYENNTMYIINIMGEMSNYHQTISETYSFFSNATISFSDDYYNFYKNTYVFQRTLSNGIPSSNMISFSNTISTVTMNLFLIKLNLCNY